MMQSQNKRQDDALARLTPTQRVWLMALGLLVVLGLLLSGVLTGIWMIINGRDTTEALLVMAVPFGGILLLFLVGAGVSSVVRDSQGVIGTDAVRYRIVALLGMALFVGLIGVLLIAAFSERDIPGALLTLVSTIAGGLIGVLTPGANTSAAAPTPPAAPIGG